MPKLSSRLRSAINDRFIIYAVGGICGQRAAFETSVRLIESRNARTVVLGQYGTQEVLECAERTWRRNHFWFFRRSRADIETWNLPSKDSGVIRDPQAIVQGATQDSATRLQQFLGQMRDSYGSFSADFDANVVDPRSRMLELEGRTRQGRALICSVPTDVATGNEGVINLPPAMGDTWLSVALIDDYLGKAIATLEISPDGGTVLERMHISDEELEATRPDLRQNGVLFAKGGDRVVYRGGNGYPPGQNEIPEIGASYSVLATDPFSAHAFLYLEEFPGLTFSTMGFRFEDEDAAQPALFPLPEQSTVRQPATALVSHKLKMKEIPTDQQVAEIERRYFKDGVLIRFPSRYGHQLIALRMLTRRIDSRRSYDERELTELLGRICKGRDLTALKRDLVDAGMIQRDAYGRIYQLTEMDGQGRPD